MTDTASHSPTMDLNLRNFPLLSSTSNLSNPNQNMNEKKLYTELRQCITDCTSKNARYYMDLLGIKQSNPVSQKPSFDTPVLKTMYQVTRNKVKELIRKYDSPEALKRDFHSTHLLLDVTNSIMKTYAHRIWGRPKMVGQNIGHSRLCEGSLDCTVNEDCKRIETYLFCWIITRAYRQIREPPPDNDATLTVSVPGPDQTTLADGSSEEDIDLEWVARTVVQKSPVDFGQDSSVPVVSDVQTTTFSTRMQPDKNDRADALYDDIPLEGSDQDWQDARNGVKRKKGTKAAGRGDKLPKVRKTFKRTQGQLKEMGTRINYNPVPSQNPQSPVGGIQSNGQVEGQPDGNERNVSGAQNPIHEIASPVVHEERTVRPGIEAEHGASQSAQETTGPILQSRTTPTPRDINSNTESQAPAMSNAPYHADGINSINPVNTASETAFSIRSLANPSQRHQVSLAYTLMDIGRHKSDPMSGLEHTIAPLQDLLGLPKYEQLLSDCFRDNLNGHDQGLSIWISLAEKLKTFSVIPNFPLNREKWRECMMALPKDQQSEAMYRCLDLHRFAIQVRDKYDDPKSFAKNVAPALYELCELEYIFLDAILDGVERISDFLYL